MKTTIIIISLILTACGGIPNNVTMNINSQQCAPSSYAPSANNPSKAPYCLGITINNNNSGYGANNIQVSNSTGGGFYLSYAVAENTYAGFMYDPTAAAVDLPASQIIGNIKLYDPNNCVTTQGINVQIINSNGGSCSFYLQLMGESYSIGNYPISLNYFYTNGNSNYTLNQTIAQQVSLYAGGDFGDQSSIAGVASYNGESNTFISTNFNSNNVKNLAGDHFGNLYAANESGIIYRYNGIKWNIFNQGIANNISTVNTIYADSWGNMYAASDQGLYQLTPNSSTWQLYGNLNDINGLQNYNNLFYATARNILYQCNYTNCIWSESQIIAGTINNNTLKLDHNFLPYLGATTGAWGESNGMWINFSGYSNNVSALGFNNLNQLYVLANDSSASESTVYTIESGSNQLTPLMITGGSLLGNGYSIYIDNNNNIYIGGNFLTSTEFTNVAVAYLAANTNAWIAISGIPDNGTVKSLVSLSRLVSQPR